MVLIAGSTTHADLNFDPLVLSSRLASVDNLHLASVDQTIADICDPNLEGAVLDALGNPSTYLDKNDTLDRNVLPGASRKVTRISGRLPDSGCDGGDRWSET